MQDAAEDYTVTVKKKHYTITFLTVDGDSG